jgi:type II secretory pathway pseudopilin PulG
MNILIGVVLAAIALPQVLGYLQGRREREEFHQQIQDLRAEMRDLGERLERQQQAMFEKLSQQQQEIEALKSRQM